MSEKKKICFVIPGLNAGGMENYLLRFLQFIQETAQFTVLVRNGQGGDLYMEYIKTDVNIRFQKVGFFNPYNWYKLYRFFKKENFQTVCDFSGNFSGISLTMARLAGVKNRIVFYRRSSNAFKPTWFRLMYNNAMNKLVFNQATKILSNSQYALNFFFPYKSSDAKRFKVIPNGIDPDIFNITETKEEARRYFKLPLDKFIVGHVGRYDPAKNHQTIFKVAQMLIQENQAINFVFVGKGTDSPAFLEKIKSYEIEEICFCLGLQSNLPLLYKTMDLFYFPSVTEGQPNALIEAMMAGLPFVASNTSPIKEIVPVENFNQLFDPLEIKGSIEKI